MRYADAEGTSIDCGGGIIVPCVVGNLDYDRIVKSGVAIEPFAPPVPVARDLDAEYTRRLVALLGARDLAHAAYIRADDHVELSDLRGIASPTTEHTARIAELQSRADAVAALIDRYNAIPDNPPPADYADDSRWI